jgi:hypothetical protein
MPFIPARNAPILRILNNRLTGQATHPNKCLQGSISRYTLHRYVMSHPVCYTGCLCRSLPIPVPEHPDHPFDGFSYVQYADA